MLKHRLTLITIGLLLLPASLLGASCASTTTDYGIASATPTATIFKSSIPPENTWNYTVRTAKFAIYSRIATDTQDYVAIAAYWSQLPDGTWQWSNDSLTLTRSQYPEVQVILRPGFAAASNVDSHGNPIPPKASATPTNNQSNQALYTVISNDMIGQTRRTMTLTTVATWTGTESRNMTFRPSKSPWVWNASYVATSNIAVTCDVSVWQQVASGIQLQVNTNGGNTVSEANGAYIIKVQASGCRWTVRVGD